MSGEAGDFRSRARKGMLVLGARSFVQELVVAVSTLALARLLEPAAFGIFAIVQFALLLFTNVGDVGLAASLIQKKEMPSDRELSTVFWFQLSVTLVLAGAIWLGADLILSLWTELPESAPWLLRALSLSMLATVLGVVPRLLMERELRFVPLSIIDLVGTAGFYLAAISLALSGFGAGAFVGAVLVRSSLTLLGALIAQPWRPRPVFDFDALKRILPFGVWFQGKNIVGMLNDAVTPALAGGVLGQAALGLNNFARQTANFPLHVVGIIGRVSFPLFSRLAQDRDALTEELNFGLRLCGTVCVGFSVMFLTVGAPLVELIYHPKWLPSLNALYVYSLALVVGFMAPIIAGAFEGLGRPQVVLRFSVGWTLLNWVVVSTVVAFRQDLLSFALAYVTHMVVGNLGLLFVLRKELPGVRAVRGWIRPAFVGALVVLFGRATITEGIASVFTLVPATVLIMVLWLGLSAGVDPALAKSLGVIWSRIRRRRSEPAPS